MKSVGSSKSSDDVGDSSWEAFRHSVTSWLAWASIAAGVLATINLVARLADIGLRGLVRDAITLYRNALSPVYELIQKLHLPYEVPQLAVDSAIIYSVLLGVSWRAGPRLQRNLHAEYLKPGTMMYVLANAHSGNDSSKMKKMYEGKLMWSRVGALTLFPLISLSPLRVYIQVKGEQKQILRALVEEFPRFRGVKDLPVGDLRGWEMQAKHSLAEMIAFPFAVALLLITNDVWPK